METIVRESMPVDLGEKVVKATAAESEADKYAGLENLDVGSKFKMFERGAGEGEEEEEDLRKSSDRYGILEKLRRLEVGQSRIDCIVYSIVVDIII